MKSSKRSATFLVVGALLLIGAGSASAASTTVSFSGTITTTMTVNNGANLGSIPAGTSYTGTLTFDVGQTPTPVPFAGGTHTVYMFNQLTFTIASSTATTGPGSIDVYDNLTSSQSYPPGDSVYVNFTGSGLGGTGTPPGGPLDGAQFNWMGLALLDAGGHAIRNGALPADLAGASFPNRFSEFNYGTQGTPWGAGNTSTIQPLTALSSNPGGTPTVTIDSGPQSPTNDTSASIFFHATETGHSSFTYSCSLDSGAFSACSSPMTYAGLDDGYHIFHVIATDELGDVSHAASASWLVDTTAPTLALPGNIAADATSPSGATVQFTARASDPGEPDPIVICSPAPGSLFAIGSTTVSCSASDQAGNASSGTFTVVVLGGKEQIDETVGEIGGWHLDRGTTAKLTATLQVAERDLAGHHPAHACQHLTVFAGKLRESRRQLTAAQAQQLLADANRIRTVIGCTAPAASR